MNKKNENVGYLSANQFRLSITGADFKQEDIDTVKLPVFGVTEESQQHEHFFAVQFKNRPGMSVVKWARDLMRDASKTTSIRLELLDSDSKVVESWNFSEVRPVQMSSGDLNKADKTNLLLTAVVFVYNTLDID